MVFTERQKKIHAGIGYEVPQSGERLYNEKPNTERRHKTLRKLNNMDTSHDINGLPAHVIQYKLSGRKSWKDEEEIGALTGKLCLILSGVKKNRQEGEEYCVKYILITTFFKINVMIEYQSPLKSESKSS